MERGDADPFDASARHDGLDAVDVLTRAGRERAWVCDQLQLDDDARLDRALVADLIRSNERVGDTLSTRHAIVDLCTLLRAIDAAERGLIQLDELRHGLGVHAERSDGFADLHDARILLRTLGEVLDAGRAEHRQRPVLAQLRFIHRELRSWLLDQLVGPAARRPGAASGEDRSDAIARRARAPMPSSSRLELGGNERAAASSIVDDLLHGSRHHPVAGMVGAAWIRGWHIVPVAGDRLDDDDPSIERLAAALHAAGIHGVVRVDLAQPQRWRIEAGRVHVQSSDRAAWRAPATVHGLTMLVRDELRRAAAFTTLDEAFAIVESEGHHVVAGPRALVEALLGMPPVAAIARFRSWVEDLAGENEPPEHLLDAAMRCGRYRIRAR